MSETLHRNLIGGAWREGTGARPNINPSDTSDVIGSYSQAGAADVADAVAAAAKAFESWQFSSIQDRFDALDRIGAELLARREELGRLLSREEGKTLKEGIGEVARAGSVFKFFAGECLRISGELLASTRPGVTVEVTREPVGVVGLITPWNFPMAIPAWKIAPALCYGNTVVFKPAELVPGCAWALIEIISRAGLPPGVCNLVMGKGSIVGEALVGSAAVSAITFTGSVSTGQSIVAKAAARGAKVQVEMGGKNPLVVLDDADLEIAVNCALQGAYFSTGQRCTASSRLVVTQGVHDRFVAALKQKLEAVKVGHALEPTTDIGPVVDDQQLEQDLSYLDIGRQEGATLAYGGRRLERATAGFYLEPALFTDSAPGMRINQEEIFGPVASVIRVRDFDEALVVANGVPFGLSAGIVTTSLKHAAAFRRRSQAGMVMVNVPTAGVDYHVPFGGRKSSSYGPREQGRYAMDFYTTVKTAYIAP
ncbi:MAG TPA: aldehyde dehydrogenase family protein [Steroidobacteraceae bacterium]|jgi:aldehyde dehydrogenase (NAD+)|nr:aldehyde dehydrogenase family protein [Steroidobacteraceae bacterium]